MDGTLAITVNWLVVFVFTVILIYTCVVVVFMYENDNLRGQLKRSRAREEILLDKLETKNTFKGVRRG